MERGGDEMRLRDRVAVVTGAQQGIGAAIARAYGREGAGVVINYLDDAEAAEAIAAEICGAGGRAVAVPGDVARAGDVAALIAAAEAFGGVDLLVNNAGIFPRVGFLDMTEDQWDQVLDVNLKSAFLCARAAAQAMVARGVPGAILKAAAAAIPLGRITRAEEIADTAVFLATEESRDHRSEG